jgi:hypothetical protein
MDAQTEMVKQAVEEAGRSVFGLPLSFRLGREDEDNCVFIISLTTPTGVHIDVGQLHCNHWNAWNAEHPERPDPRRRDDNRTFYRNEPTYHLTVMEANVNFSVQDEKFKFSNFRDRTAERDGNPSPLFDLMKRLGERPIPVAVLRACPCPG